MVDIVRYSVVDDVGTVLNPLLLHGQVHGGIAQGAGQALMEDIHFDASGQLVTASFMDYAMPHAHDLCEMEVESNPVPTKTNPLGTKGAGEAGCVGALPAVTNALVDALSEFGVKHIEMPATPERIWRAMQRPGRPRSLKPVHRRQRYYPRRCDSFRAAPLRSCAWLCAALPALVPRRFSCAMSDASLLSCSPRPITVR